MKKRTWLVLVACAGVLAAPAARATHHLIAIDQVFPGFEEAPAAQYVVLRTQAALQTVVHGQQIFAADAAGNPQPPFAAFCTTTGDCDLPDASPACAPDQCPPPGGANDRKIFVATRWAEGLFCITPDLRATGSLPDGGGQVCFGDTGPFSAECLAAGPVDCVAYGQFTGATGLFGDPAPSPMPGESLIAVAGRQAQCHTDTLDAPAICFGGHAPYIPCNMDSDCPGGACVECPAGGCQTLLSSAVGFAPLAIRTAPTAAQPRNFHGDIGRLEGVAGDADGSFAVDAEDVQAEVDALFTAGSRCELPRTQRGADANLDTRVSAADVVATILIAAPSF